MRLSILLASLVAALANSASLDINDLEVLESLREIPQGWHSTGSPEKEHRIVFRVSLHSENEDDFHKTLAEVSNPFHERYGQHLSKLEMRDLVKPSRDSTRLVMQWLCEAGVADKDVYEKGDWVNFVATVEQAERIFNTTFETYQSDVQEDITRVGTLSYSIPRELHNHVAFVHPAIRFPQIRTEYSNIRDKETLGFVGHFRAAVINSSCDTTITPQCLRDLYNIKGYTPSSNPDVSGFLGVNGFLEQYARYADLEKFNAQFAPWAVGTNFSWTSIAGGLLDQNAANDSTEANLDIQYTVSLSYPIHNNYYSTAGRGLLVPDLDQPTQADNQNEPYLDMFTYLSELDDDELPHTLTTSYGEDEQSVPAAYSQKVCNMIGALGARGVSIIFSSGDTGVGSACQTNDGKNTTRFLPIFPASCPYVTSVGGTHHIPERAVSFSSGGFSDRWPRPWWQADAVNSYLDKLGSQWQGLYNPLGRGFPDVSAQGQSFRVVEKGRLTLVGGTSASAPVFAAIIALLNAARIEVGNRPLGFLNPWLYKVAASSLNDITEGGSTGCTGEDIYSGLPAPFVEFASWNATQGWDPVTGLGTPDFQKLLALAKSNARVPGEPGASPLPPAYGAGSSPPANGNDNGNDGGDSPRARGYGGSVRRSSIHA